MNDLKFAFRQLLKNPGFTAVAVLTLALGIGANTAIFSVINAVLLRPLPFRDPDRLVWLYQNKPSREWFRFPRSTEMFKFLREHSRSFEQLGLAGPTDFYLSGDGSPELLRGLKVSANLCDLLGIQPLLGRSFLPEENQPTAPRVALLSHRLWQRRFAADPAIVGKIIRQDDQSYAIVGVLPPQLKFPIGLMPAWRVLSTGEPDIWLPITFISPREPDREAGFAIARLKPEVSTSQAQAEMRVVAQQHERAYAKVEGWSIDVVPMREQVAGQIRPALILLFGAVSAVLLIACVNVTNLLLARAMNRQKEFAIRAALGAGRLQLTRQLLAESILLSGLGGILGVLFALWGIRVLTWLSPVSLPLTEKIQIDGGVLAFTLGVSILAGLLFGLAPAWHVWRQNFGGSIQNADKVRRAISGSSD